jgi:hypothetical protein
MGWNWVGARAFAAGSFLALCSCWALGCDEGHAGHYYGHPGPGYGPAPWVGAIRFEWSLPGSAPAGDDDDAGALAESDAGLDADAGASASSSANQDACDAIGATEFQALLLNQGTIVAAVQTRCAAGSETFRVQSNDYTATAALVTKDGVPVTETEAIPSFIVAAGEKQIVRIAFERLASAP